VPGADNPRWKRNLGIQSEIHVVLIEDFVWCEHHNLVHDKIRDVYETGEKECAPMNWLDIYVALDDPIPRNPNEETWESRAGATPKSLLDQSLIDPNALLRQGLEVNVPIPPPLTNVQRLADEILAQRGVRQQKGG
jgi:hypothetical protein